MGEGHNHQKDSKGVFFYNSKVFGLRDLSNHKQHQARQFTVSEGHITFNEFMSKTVKCGLKESLHLNPFIYLI